MARRAIQRVGTSFPDRGLFLSRVAAVEYLRSKLDEFAADAPPHIQSVLQLKLAGFTHNEIADELKISKRTVDYRLASLKENTPHAWRIRNLQNVR